MAMQDMVPPEEESRSIRNLKINKKDDAEGDTSAEQNRESADSSRDFSENRQHKNNRIGNYNRRNKSYKWWFVALAAIIVIFVFIALTPILSSARVEVTPRTQMVEIDGEFDLASGESETGLTYQTATFEVEEERQVEATGEEQVNTKASGRIRVFNAYSEEAETLIANTRFESEDGLIYRVQNAFTVPGTNTTGGETVPGTIEVTVYADEAGEEYNLSSGRFTIPGLQGDPRFDEIHAETVTKIEGGFSGVTKVASEEDTSAAYVEIEEEAKNKAMEKASSSIPDEFVLIPGIISVEFERLPNGESQGSQVIVRGRSVAKVVLIKKDDLAGFIASETIGAYDGESVKINNIDSVDIQPLETEGESSLVELVSSGESISIAIEGSPLIVWHVDYDELKDELLGVSKGEAQEVLGGYGSIREARIFISPFWKRTIPENEEKFTIKEVLKQND